MDPLGALGFFQSRGWTPAQSAGIIGNLIGESNWNPAIPGDGGRAYGLAQWHPDRQSMFQRVFGRPIQGSSIEQQLGFVDWELRNTERRAGNLLRGTSNVQDATRVFMTAYERPANASSLPRRIGAATSILSGVRNTIGEAGNAAQRALENIPGMSILFGARDSLLGWESPTGSCGLDPICALREWIEGSGFFQRIAIAFLAFIILLAAFYLMKGNTDNGRSILKG